MYVDLLMTENMLRFVLFYCHSYFPSVCTRVTVGGAQAWASAEQLTLADRKKWLTPTTTRMEPTHLLLALMKHHKELQVDIPQFVATVQPTAQDGLRRNNYVNTGN